MGTATEQMATEPRAAGSADSPALARVREQIGWYDRKSQYNQRWFKGLKICQIVAAAGIPVAAAGSLPDWILGAAGALIVVLESLQQLQQYQQNWITYRSTCEALKHEKFLYLCDAGPYARARNKDRLLAERVEGLVSQEHARWTSGQEDLVKREQTEAQ